MQSGRPAVAIVIACRDVAPASSQAADNRPEQKIDPAPTKCPDLDLRGLPSPPLFGPQEAAAVRVSGAALAAQLGRRTAASRLALMPPTRVHHEDVSGSG